jgi:hypothetical protein
MWCPNLPCVKAAHVRRVLLVPTPRVFDLSGLVFYQVITFLVMNDLFRCATVLPVAEILDVFHPWSTRFLMVRFTHGYTRIISKALSSRKNGLIILQAIMLGTPLIMCSIGTCERA